MTHEALGAVSAPPFRALAARSDLEPAGKLVVTVDGVEVLLLVHEDRVVALANRCIHRDRELSQGFLLKGRIVCPGHQWSFALEDGFCKERDRSQPVYETRVVDGTIEVAI
ncbi:MAG TPA: Rieske 2Fe-2S domain-containing protein [Iamia sp.]|nr:Rieske 2Fe-2S domain-containing protein [Iamia sp.]